MKELYLIRHAKSDWEHAHLDDFDRPLNDRGLRDAPKMARAIAMRWERPAFLITSPAIRAFQTAQFFRKEWGVDWSAFRMDPSVYEATAETLLSLIQDVLPAHSRLALVGHNPGISLLIDHLIGSETDLKTCCAARIEIKESGLTASSAELRELFSPRDF